MDADCGQARRRSALPGDVAWRSRSGLPDADARSSSRSPAPLTLSRYGRRSALAGRMRSFPSAPHLSLTDSVTLSRKERRPALAGQTPNGGTAPHVSRNAVTGHATGRMRSRGKDVLHPGGHDVSRPRHHKTQSGGPVWHNVELVRPLPARAEGYYRVGFHTTEKIRKHSGWKRVARSDLLCFLDLW
jgi:hypothetical protein